MRRLAPIITSILLGALAVAIGMGVYLKKANDDRERLADIANKAQAQATTATNDRDRAVQEANVKLSAANAEVAKAQELVKALQEERTLLAQAQILNPLSVSARRGWTDLINLPLGISLKLPPGNHVVANDAQSLTVAVGTSDTTDFWNAADQRWLSITAYDDRLENELLAAFATSTPVSYAVQDTLLIGSRGTLPSKTGSIFVLRVRSAGKITHLIWGRDPLSREDARTLLQTLSTLDLKK